MWWQLHLSGRIFVVVVFFLIWQTRMQWRSMTICTVAMMKHARKREGGCSCVFTSM